MCICSRCFDFSQIISNIAFAVSILIFIVYCYAYCVVRKNYISHKCIIYDVYTYNIEYIAGTKCIDIEGIYCYAYCAVREYCRSQERE